MKKNKIKDSNDFDSLKEVLRFVWKNKFSSFYRDKYKTAGINLKDIKTISDLQKLPYLTKEEIVKSDPLRRLFLPASEIFNVGISSGTASNDVPSIVFKSRLSQVIRKRVIKEFKELKQRNILYLFPPLRAAQYATSKPLGESKIQGIKLAGDITNLPITARITAKLNINMISTSPTTLYYFTPHLKREYALDNIRYIMLSGELCSNQKALFFKKNFKNAKIIYQYGMSENDGTIGIHCDFLNSLTSHYFHPSPENYYEIIEGEEKELAITNLFSSMFPLIRYRTGDGIETEDFECKCGAKRRFKLLGRINHDIVKVHGVIIYAHLVDKALQPFLKYLSSPNWQLHIFENLEKEKIFPRFKIQFILKKNYQSHAEKIKDTIIKGLSENWYLSAKKTLADLVEEEIFKPLELEFIKKFPDVTKHEKIISHLD